jgi:hypothetical protein
MLMNDNTLSFQLVYQRCTQTSQKHCYYQDEVYIQHRCSQIKHWLDQYYSKCGIVIHGGPRETFRGSIRHFGGSRTSNS